MKVLVALAVGYVVGAHSGRRDLDQVVASVKALRESDELADVVAAVRSHVSHTLRGLADSLERPASGGPQAADGDLVERVRGIIGQD